MPNAGACGCGREARGPHCDGFLAGSDALVGSDGHIDVRHVESRGREAGGVVDHLAASSGRFVTESVAVVLGDDEEPGDGEGGGVGGVDDGIEDIEAGQREAVEGRLGADMRSQEGANEQCQ